MRDRSTDRTLRRGAALAIAGLAFAVLTECSDSSGPRAARTVYGPAVPMGNGTATGYVTLDDHGAPTAVGAQLTPAALVGLPMDKMTTEFVVPLPRDASPTTVDHIVINWQPRGHPPTHIYTVPHFDVHLYQITEGARAAIGPSDPQWPAKVAANPSADQVPPGYVAEGVGIPRMGKHWADASAAQYHGQPFTSTFIYGSYAGEFIFYEPMVALAYLQSHPTLHATISVGARQARPGVHPTGYGVLYDPGSSTYRIQAEGWKP